MFAEGTGRFASIVTLALLVFVLVALPCGDAFVRADGGGTGHPIEPPPPDSSQYMIEPAPELPPVNETALLISGLSMLVL